MIPEDIDSDIAIELMGHTLTLAENSTINCNRETSLWSLDAARIVGLESGAPLFRSSHSILFVADDISLIVPEGGVVIESDWGGSSDDFPEFIDPLYFLVNFSGTVSGDIILNNSSLTIDTEEGNFDIGTLSLKGAQCRCDVITERESPVKINAVDGDVKNISCVRAGDVKIASGGEAHVHDFKYTLVDEATCHERAVYLGKCAICGYEEYFHIDEDENPEYGPCDKTTLQHVEAKDPTDFEDGNTEYWRCPYCGKRYSDAEGKNEITDLSTTVIRLKDFYADYDMLHALDDITFIPDQGGTKAALEIFNTVVGVTSAVSTLSGFNFLSIKDWAENADERRHEEYLSILADLSEKMDELNNKMDVMQNSVNLIGEKLEDLKKQVSANGYFSVLYKRNDDVRMIKSASVRAMKALYTNVVKREDDVTRLFAPLEYWATHYPSAFDEIIKYLSEFSESNIIIQGLNKSINSVPALYKEFAESQEVWEHQAYANRAQFLIKDHDMIIEPYLIACLYLDLVRNEIPCFSERQKIDPTTADFLYKDLQKAYKEYVETLSKDNDQMKERQNNIRKCLIREAACVLKTGTTPHSVEDADLERYRLPLGTENKNVFCDNVLQFEKDFGLDHNGRLFTLDQARHIYDWYRANRTEKNFYDILINDASINVQRGKLVAKNDEYRNANKCVSFAEMLVDYSGNGCSICLNSFIDDKGQAFKQEWFAKLYIDKKSGNINHDYMMNLRDGGRELKFESLEYADEKWWN